MSPWEGIVSGIVEWISYIRTSSCSSFNHAGKHFFFLVWRRWPMNKLKEFKTKGLQDNSVDKCLLHKPVDLEFSSQSQSPMQRCQRESALESCPLTSRPAPLLSLLPPPSLTLALFQSQSRSLSEFHRHDKSPDILSKISYLWAFLWGNGSMFFIS